jgi:hypothetical protein
MILENFKEGNNFWEFNPQYKVMFKEFYDSDKSKKKETSSKIMWSMMLCYHPKSDFYNLPNKEEVIAKKFINDPKFKWESYVELKEMIVDSVLTQAEKSLDNWNRTLKKRDEFIHEQEFTLDHYDDKGRLAKGSADQLDKMLANTNKLYQEYFSIVKELEQEELARSKGNKIKSMSDLGDI